MAKRPQPPKPKGDGAPKPKRRTGYTASRPSSVDKLPLEIRDEIGRLRGEGYTIDEILAALRELDVVTISRSTLGRHVKGMERLGAKLRHSRNIAEALVRQLGDEPASRAAQLNIELLHTTITDLFLAQNDDGEIDENGKAALNGSPEGIMLLAKAMDHLTKSAKADAEYAARIEAKVEARFKKQAEAGLAAVAREKGFSAENMAFIRQQILGTSK
ncbi:hypothetical protein C0V97_01040 [Asaia sp. W19]|uniref:DUF3486 family protein n=1 Tax=unclassified Asaia TaxID=2685023 RepID=UPI000F8ED1E5|nr:DUF3486 family protein [Asaia sp. W19]RUT27385.1 hypothetical protein C0V97_01040 [Asaia sp. W19]